MCKLHFKNILINEYSSNSTYELIKCDKKVLDKRLLAFAKRIKSKTCSLKYPYLFPAVKFHKTPIKYRFVTCNTDCYNSIIGKEFFEILKIILDKIKQEENFIIESNIEILDFLKDNPIHNLQTFDFENLYTSLPHNKLIEACSTLFDLYLLNSKITKNYWMDLCIFNISENYVFNGINFYRQAKGIPMGNSFSSALANVFLHTYERNIIKNNIIFGFRYIDDLLLINLEESKVVINSYPDELKLNKTNENPQSCNYLDLEIKISEENVKIGIYDKRKDFNFKTISLTHFSSNISRRVLKNILFNQIFRISKICNNQLSFSIATNFLISTIQDNHFPNNYCNYNTLIQKTSSSLFPQ